MSGPPLILMSILAKAFTALSTTDTIAIENIIVAYDPKTAYPHGESYKAWWREHGLMAALDTMKTIVYYTEAIDLLGFVGTYSQKMTMCEPELFSLQEQAYLWAGIPKSAFCRVLLADGTVNYNPIAQLAIYLQDVVSGADVLDRIINGFQLAQLRINVDRMRNSCRASLSYEDMKTPLLADVCGCYIAIPTEQFTTDEQYLLGLNPECMPSCLSAAIRYVNGGFPIPCQQELCIADDINITGTSAKISQVCGQCNKRFECVCYIHVNGRLVDNQTCSKVYEVSKNGTITSTINNESPAIGSGLSRVWSEIFESTAGILALLAAGALVVVLIFALLISQHLRHRSPKTSFKSKGWSQGGISTTYSTNRI